MRNLRTLDLSHNRINELPEELGLCFNLRYLFFDNNIKTLPYSFGNMIELLFIGIEGNPLEPSIANLIAEKGTKELIATLRDQTTVKRTPKPRCWLTLRTTVKLLTLMKCTKVEPESSDSFTVLSLQYSLSTLCYTRTNLLLLGITVGLQKEFVGKEVFELQYRYCLYAGSWKQKRSRSSGFQL